MFQCPFELALQAQFEVQAQLWLPASLCLGSKSAGLVCRGEGGEAEGEGACGGEVGEGRSRWGPAPEQPGSRTRGAQLRPLVSLPPQGLPGASFPSGLLQAPSLGCQALLGEQVEVWSAI